MTRPVTLLLLVLAGCSLRQPDPGKSFYMLETPALEGVAPSGSGTQTIRVARARVAPPFNTRALQYRVTADRFEPSYYHNWADDPGALTTSAVIEALNGTGTFVVVDESSEAAATRTLELYIRELAVDVTGSQPTAVLSIRATLLDPDGAVLRTLDLRRAEAAASSEAPDVVRAWSAELRAIVAELADELQDAL